MRVREDLYRTTLSRRGQGHDAACFCAECRGEEPPAPSNTGGSNRQLKTTGGVDTLEVWLMGSHSSEFFRHLPEMEQAQEYAKSKATQEHASLTVNGRRVKVHPRGVAKAKGTLYFDYKLEWDGIELLISKELPGERGEIGYLKLSSFRLMRDGHQKCWHDAQQLIDDLGIHLKDNLVARIDPCVDLPGVPVEVFCEAYIRRDFIGRARSGGLFDEGLDYTGFSRGKGPILIRVYDKLREAQKKADDAKFDVLTQRRWGGQVPEEAARVEFQLRREWLATWESVAPDGCRTEARSVEQVFDLLPSLTQYLVEHWFRIVDDAEIKREHGNQARAKPSDAWRKVVEAFALWVEGEVVQLVRRATGTPDDENALKQIAGLIARIEAATPRTYKRAREVIDNAMRRVEAIAGDGLMDKLAQRRTELEATGRGRWYDVPLRPLVGITQITHEDRDACFIDQQDLPF